MKWFKKILVVCSFCTLLTTVNCFAVTMEETKITEDELNCYKTYQVMESEKDTFLEMLSKEIEVDGNKYKYVDYTAEGGNTSETIDINTTKTILSKTNNKIWIRPETTGKATQWGDLEEIVRLSKEFEQVLPCVDFSHLHARYNGIVNTYDEFSEIFETIGNELGQVALDNFHAHVAGIEYGAKGEKKHLNLEESDFNYKDLLKAFKAFDVKGAVVCESPNIEEDAKLLKEYYLSL